MRTLAGLLVLVGLAFTHGESGRAAPSNAAPSGGFAVPHGGTGGPTNARGGPVTIVPSDGRGHTWEVWWSYNREWILAQRLRGTPVTGLAANDSLSRKQLREEEIYDLMLHALEDKNHDVRAAAAVALGKFGDRRADRYLQRHIHYPGENWFDVREAAVYGMGILGLEENRQLMTTIAGDKEKSNRKRSLALVSLMMDKTTASADILVWHAKYFHTGIRTPAQVEPLTSEQDRRRFAAHLLGFVAAKGYDDVLLQIAEGGRPWHGGEQGLAITALGRRKAREHKEALFRMLYRRELDKDAVRSVPLALGMMLTREDKDDIKRLAAFIRDSKRDNVAQNFAVMALANIGGEQVVDIYDDLLRNRVFNTDSDRNFVYLALGLVGLRSEKARDILLAELRKARTQTERGALAMACGLARVKEAIPPTLEYLDKSPLAGGEGSSSFLGWGALALGLHGDATQVPVVRKVFKKYSDARVRESAAIALTLLEGKAAVPELVEILKEAGTMHTKAAVVTALGLLPDPSREAVDALKAAYRDDSMQDNVRAMAIIALGALADPRAVPLSATLVANYNYFIRCAALDEIATLL